jgi:hypothetical protein
MEEAATVGVASASDPYKAAVGGSSCSAACTPSPLSVGEAGTGSGHSSQLGGSGAGRGLGRLFSLSSLAPVVSAAA